MVDDGSTDATPEILDALACQDRRVRVPRNPEALGPCEARNRGVAVASGDFIATCDDDDAWLPGAATTMMAYLDDHPEVGAATAWHQVAHARRVVDFRGPLEYGSDELLWWNMPAISFIVVRREAFSSDPWYDPDFVTGEDWDLQSALRPGAAIPHRPPRALQVPPAPRAESHRPSRTAPAGARRAGREARSPSCLRPVSPTTAPSWSSRRGRQERRGGCSPERPHAIRCRERGRRRCSLAAGWRPGSASAVATRAWRCVWRSVWSDRPGSPNEGSRQPSPAAPAWRAATDGLIPGWIVRVDVGPRAAAPPTLGAMAMGNRPEVETAQAPIAALDVALLAQQLGAALLRVPFRRPMRQGGSNPAANLGICVTREVIRTFMGYASSLAHSRVPQRRARAR